MTISSQVGYLLSYLQDEFQAFPDVRVVTAPTTVRQRSPDLEPIDPRQEDYRPREEGVMVRTQRREYFFPASWIQSKRYADVHQLAQEIREAIEQE